MTSDAPALNPYVGTWRLASATLEKDGETVLPFGEHPNGLLSFTPDLHFVEVLLHGDTPRFASDELGEGSDAENREVLAKTIGIFGSYSVGEDGEFLGDRVEGCTFPNWIGDVRTPKEISAHVEGDRMREQFRQPTGATITLLWDRVR